MKKYIFILLCIVSVLPLSCSLEEQIYDKPVLDNTFKNEKDAEAALLGAYEFLTTLGYYKENYLSMIITSADNIWGLENNALGVFSNKKYTNDEEKLYQAWYNIYRTINAANLVIKYVPDIDMDEVRRKEIVGEARFLRALCYFNLVRTWGAVPVYLEPFMYGQDPKRAKSSVEDIYKIIIDDFTKIIDEEELPHYVHGVTETGRATLGAAQGMLSLVYLTKYTMCPSVEGDELDYVVKYATDVIESGDYRLVNYDRLWDVNNKKDAYQEVLFGVKFSRDASASGGAATGSCLAWIYSPANVLDVTGITNASGEERGGIGAFKVQPWFAKKCFSYFADQSIPNNYSPIPEYIDGSYVFPEDIGRSHRDYRLDATFATYYLHSGAAAANPKGTVKSGFYPSVANNKDVFIIKYKDPDSYENRNGHNDFFVMRLAEVHYILAEAYILKGEFELARQQINILRERARRADGTPREWPLDLQAGDPVMNDEDSFMEFLLFEKSFELLSEPSRWFDLVRMRRTNGDSYYTYMFRDYLPNNPDANVSGIPRATLRYDDYRCLFPIPAREIQGNKALTEADQNPGY